MEISKRDNEIYMAVVRGESNQTIGRQYGVHPRTVGYIYRNVLIYNERMKDDVWRFIFSYCDTQKEATEMYRAFHTYFAGHRLSVKKILSVSPDAYEKYGYRIGKRKKEIIERMIFDTKFAGGELK